MTAPLYLLDHPGPDDPEASGADPWSGLRPGDRLVLAGPEGRHAVTVCRTRVGQRLDVADGRGRLARCLVTRVVPDRVELNVQTVEVEVPTRPAMVLAQALAKGGRDELAVQTATELGVDEVVPWQAARSVVVWSGERGRRSHAKWVHTVRAAAKQSRRARVPVVAGTVTTAGLLDRVARTVAADGLALVLHQAAETRLAGLQVPTDCSEVLVVVGPEGGIEDGELADLIHAGAHPVRLGPQVLRTSSAGAAALAVLSVVTGRWT